MVTRRKAGSDPLLLLRLAGLLLPLGDALDDDAVVGRGLRRAAGREQHDAQVSDPERLGDWLRRRAHGLWQLADNGLAICAFMIFEPNGIAYRWWQAKNYVNLWPFSY